MISCSESSSVISSDQGSLTLKDLAPIDTEPTDILQKPAAVANLR
jgi:hypothetical protein